MIIVLQENIVFNKDQRKHIKDKKVKLSDVLVYIFLHLNKKSKPVESAELLGIGFSTYYKSIKRLRSLGWIDENNVPVECEDKV